MYLKAVKPFFKNLQNHLCQQLEHADQRAKFVIDNWHSQNVIEASTRIIVDGAVFEHGAVNFSQVQGHTLPPAATARYPQLTGASFNALGVSLILHPLNPHVPTVHANWRFFQAQNVWWFGGGYDLTPYYPYLEDCIHWHRTAQQGCDPFGTEIYLELKNWCDRYFFLPHRNETRGIGGLFFDDWNRWEFATCFDFVKSIANSFLPGYLPIVQKRKELPYTEQERDFQLYRRGRYVEFNLLHDRGTLFGIQTNGRTESILASLPPLVKWRYNWQPQPGSREHVLYQDFLRARDWLGTQVLVES